MLDIGWAELLTVGVVALLVVGPKELPALAKTIGRYVGMIRRQANEFRAQFDEAIQDSEFDEVRKEFSGLKSDAEKAVGEVSSAAETSNFSIDELDWLKDDEPTSPAAAAAAAAATRAKQTEPERGIAAPEPSLEPHPSRDEAPSETGDDRLVNGSDVHKSSTNGSGSGADDVPSDESPRPAAQSKASEATAS
ncbi:MAG: Sec-independent protein translocase protein TatB [Pseudomonadota bacterium]